MEPDDKESVPDLALDESTLSFLLTLFPRYGEGFKSMKEMLGQRNPIAVTQ